jgi:hypothetical protein
VAILSPTNVRFELRDPDFIYNRTFENNLNGFLDFYHGTNKGSGSPKAMVYLWLLVPCDQEAKCFGYRVKLDEGNDKSHLRKMHSLATLHRPFCLFNTQCKKKTLK